MKILICNDLIYGGGAETLYRCLVNYFVKKGYSVTAVASPEKMEDFCKAFPQNVYCVCARPPRRKFQKLCFNSVLDAIRYKMYRVGFRLKFLFKKHDVVIVFKSIYLKDAFSFRTKRKYVWVHSDYRGIHEKGWFKRIYPDKKKEFEYLSKFNKVVCVSETAKEGIIQTVGDTGNLCVLYNPINASKIRVLADERCSFVNDNLNYLLVSAGRLDHDKNYLRLLQACVLLREKMQFNLWIIGDGPQKNELEEYIEDNQLKNVRLLGFQENPYPIMKQADLFISSSINETYGLAIQESLILGIPAVAVKCSGVVESFDDRFGVLVDDSAEDISEGIYNILSSRDLYMGYKRNINEQYPLKQVYTERLELICNLLEKKND